MRLVRHLFAFLLLSSVLMIDTAWAQSSSVAETSTLNRPEPDSLFNRLIRQQSYGLEFTNHRFSGPGWTKLTESVNASPLVLIGEDHGMAQIPLFTQAVAELLHPSLYVAEIDPYTAATLNGLLKQPGLPVAYQRQYFQALSFYSMTEEYELLQALQAKQTKLIGIEQIPYSFAGQLFTLMAQKTKNVATRTYLQKQARQYQTQFETSMRQHTFVRPSESSIDSLLMMTEGESGDVQKMASDFVTSYRIYEASARRTGGHQQRINFMKRNLLETLSPYLTTNEGSLPTMLFKFGANHMARNLSVWSSVFDVGNLVVNLADAQSKKSLHIMIVGKQGTKAGYIDIDNPTKPAPAAYSKDMPFLTPFFDQTMTTQWQLFDLRPMRRAIITDKLQVPNQELEATILGYDYLVVIPETTGSHTY